MSEELIQQKMYSRIRNNFSVTGIEVSVLNRCVDIAYFNKEKELVTIEVKINDWRKAVKQASDHQLYADRSYICLPKKQSGISQDLLDILKKSGIGLMIFEPKKHDKFTLKECVKAKKNDSCWPMARKKIESMLYA